SGLVRAAVTVWDPSAAPVAVTVKITLWPAASGLRVNVTGPVAVRPAGSVTATVEPSGGRALAPGVGPLTGKLVVLLRGTVDVAGLMLRARVASWNSKAPTSGNSAAPRSGRGKPRSSVVGAPAATPLSIAGLPGSRASVSIVTPVAPMDGP